MLRNLIMPTVVALAFVPAAAWAQSTAIDDDVQNIPQKIHDELTAKGFKDVKVVPGSYIVSGEDKDGNPVMMVIGPNSMTVMKGTPLDGSQGDAPSIAEKPDQKGDLIQQ
jgi:hypothetical protein